MSLQEEISLMSKVINTDSYSMSIGELSNLYKEKELDLHPEFQRFFRWDIKQKSNLIESILLGIPIPPIFVSQSETGIWDVIDGLQRLSTIFEFMGILLDENKELKAASILTKTKFLPSLEAKQWEIEDDSNSLTSSQRMYLKRAKLDIKIIEKTSDGFAKYELFQRLNTGGTHLSPQEIRNCILVMINKEFYSLIKEMNELEAFSKTIPLTDNNIEQQTDLEFVVRFIVARHSDLDRINKEDNMHDYLTDQIIEIAQNSSFDFESEKTIFIETFSYLKDLLGEDVFKKYSQSKGRFEGGVLVNAFESIVLGVSTNIREIKQKTLDEITLKIKEIYSHSIYLENTRRGVRPMTRYRNLSKFSLELFSYEN